MLFFKRRRLLFWLIKAYLKKWGKIIFLSFVISLLIFGFLFLNRKFILSKIPSTSSKSIGVVGIFSSRDVPNNLPDFILEDTSRGLTKIDSKGEVKPDLALKWEIKDDGKTFIFYLRDDVYFSDGKKFDSGSINFNFEDVVIEKPAKTVIIFKLKNKYSPFLVTLANNKIFKKNFVGVSDFKIRKIEVNAGFVDYIELYSKNKNQLIKYDFYDNQDTLKSAYVLGEVTRIVDINNLDYKQLANLSTFNNSKSEKVINDTKLVTIFLNNQDPVLSDKKIRRALAYSLPDSFKDGIRNTTPYPPNFWTNSSSYSYKMDLEYAKEQMSDSSASEGGKLKIELRTLPQYRSLAEEITRHWKKIGIEANIEVTPGVPAPYQAFLGELPVLKDPDQYTLWHTGQPGNITNYRNLRIDKLLEDGRQIYGRTERKNIYDDFQKYLIDDMPAIFLFFPYTYTLSRK